MRSRNLQRLHPATKSAEIIDRKRATLPCARPQVKRGRPTAYNSARPDQIIAIMRLGYSVAVVACVMGVSRAAIYAWARVHAEFSTALELAKAMRVLKLECDLLDATDATVMRRCIFLLKRADPEEWGASSKRPPRHRSRRFARSECAQHVKIE